MVSCSSAPRPLNFVQDLLSKPQTRLINDVPPIPSALLKRAQNCIKYSDNNNDLLEFIGDRAVNLFVAAKVDGDKINKAHHTVVRSVVCNNDTLGRLSFHLRFHHGAELDNQDSKDVLRWDSFSANTPPKVLADLFEAHVGAVCIKYGWAKLNRWLDKLFSPIIKAATGDYWFSVTPEQLLGLSGPARRKPYVPETHTQAKLLDYIEYKREALKSSGRRCLETLQEPVRYRFDQRCGRLQDSDAERVEVAIHLVNMWVCNIAAWLWPEYHTAKSGAAHLFSAITGLIVNERVMASLARLLDLDDFFAVAEEPTTHVAGSPDAPTSDLNPSSKTDGSLKPRLSSGKWQLPTASQRAIMFKATIGWNYHSDPSGTTDWGEQWFRPMVMRAHDILVDRGCRPSLSRTLVRTTSSTDEMLFSLSAQLARSLHIRDEPKSSQAELPTQQKKTLVPVMASNHSQVSTCAKSMEEQSLPKIRVVVRTNFGVSEHQGDAAVDAKEVMEKLLGDLSSLSLVASENDTTPKGDATGGKSADDPCLSTTSTDHPVTALNNSDSSRGRKQISGKWKPVGSPTTDEHKDNEPDSNLYPAQETLARVAGRDGNGSKVVKEKPLAALHSISTNTSTFKLRYQTNSWAKLPSQRHPKHLEPHSCLIPSALKARTIDLQPLLKKKYRHSLYSPVSFVMTVPPFVCSRPCKSLRS